MPGVFDRFTVNFSTQKGLALAARFRELAGERNVNKTLLALIAKWVQEQEGGSKK